VKCGGGCVVGGISGLGSGSGDVIPSAIVAGGGGGPAGKKPFDDGCKLLWPGQSPHTVRPSAALKALLANFVFFLLFFFLLKAAASYHCAKCAMCSGKSCSTDFYGKIVVNGIEE
jgi:hypothetical protein